LTSTSVRSVAVDTGSSSWSWHEQGDTPVLSHRDVSLSVPLVARAATAR
jgi:hypothetical protein